MECVAYPDNKQKQRLTGTRQLAQMTANSTNNMINSLASLEYWSLTKFGGNYATTPDLDGAGDNRLRSLNFDIQKLQAFVSLYNYDKIPVKVTCALIGIPNNNFYTGSSSGSTEITTVLRPNRSMLTKNNWRFAPKDSGIFTGYYTNSQDFSNVKHVIFDRKTITLQSSLVTTSPDATISPAGDIVGGSSITQRDIKLSHTFKRPKKLVYNASDATNDNNMSNYNIYFAITHDSEASAKVAYSAVTGCKFTLGQNTRPKVKTVS